METSRSGSVLSYVESTVGFECSNELVNQLSRNIMRSLYGNHVSSRPTVLSVTSGWAGLAMLLCSAGLRRTMQT